MSLYLCADVYHLALIRPHPGEVDSVYLAKQLSTSQVARYFARHATGSTRYGIPTSVIQSVSIPTPPKPEQTKIAEILSTVDRAIEQTEALIAKQQRIKTGLMQDLLTRGIDEHGNLRSEQTHQFKDSPLGRIPMEWEVLSIDRVISGIDAGWSPTCEDERPSEGEWGILKVSALSTGTFQPSEAKRLAPGLRSIKAIEVLPNDVLMSRANGVAELVGRCVLVAQTPEKLMLSDKTLRLNPRPAAITPFSLATLLSSPPVRVQIGTLISGSSGQKNISQKQIRSILIPVPSILEQMRSEKVIGQASRQIALDTISLAKFRAKKNGLMQDLLTGKKRFNPLLEPRLTT